MDGLDNGSVVLSFDASVNVLFDWLLDESSDGLFTTLEPRTFACRILPQRRRGAAIKQGCWSSWALMAMVRLRRWIAGVGLLAVAELAMLSSMSLLYL